MSEISLWEWAKVGVVVWLAITCVAMIVGGIVVGVFTLVRNRLRRNKSKRVNEALDRIARRNK